MNAVPEKPHRPVWPNSVIEEVQECLENFYETGRRAVHLLAAKPIADVRETPDRYLVELDLPGVNPDHCDVSVVGRMLLVRGERVLAGLTAGQGALRSERSSGKFSREILLPGEIEKLGVTAAYQSGVLRIELPKSKQTQPFKVAIQRD